MRLLAYLLGASQRPLNLCNKEIFELLYFMNDSGLLLIAAIYVQRKTNREWNIFNHCKGIGKQRTQIYSHNIGM